MDFTTLPFVDEPEAGNDFTALNDFFVADNIASPPVRLWSLCASPFYSFGDPHLHSTPVVFLKQPQVISGQVGDSKVMKEESTRLLEKEFAILSRLATLTPKLVPRAWIGHIQGNDHPIPIRTLLIEKVHGRTLCHAHLSKPNVLVSLFNSLATLNSFQVHHLDLQPTHIFVDDEDSTSPIITFIDFNLAIDFSSITEPLEPNFQGNFRFASILHHFGDFADPLVDVMSLCFILEFLEKGCLPWSNISSSLLFKHDDDDNGSTGMTLLKICHCVALHKIRTVLIDPPEKGWLHVAYQLAELRAFHHPSLSELFAVPLKYINQSPVSTPVASEPLLIRPSESQVSSPTKSGGSAEQRHLHPLSQVDLPSGRLATATPDSPEKSLVENDISSRVEDSLRSFLKSNGIDVKRGYLEGTEIDAFAQLPIIALSTFQQALTRPEQLNNRSNDFPRPQPLSEQQSSTFWVIGEMAGLHAILTDDRSVGDFHKAVFKAKLIQLNEKLRLFASSQLAHVGESVTPLQFALSLHTIPPVVGMALYAGYKTCSLRYTDFLGNHLCIPFCLVLDSIGRLFTHIESSHPDVQQVMSSSVTFSALLRLIYAQESKFAAHESELSALITQLSGLILATGGQQQRAMTSTQPPSLPTQQVQPLVAPQKDPLFADPNHKIDFQWIKEVSAKVGCSKCSSLFCSFLTHPLFLH